MLISWLQQIVFWLHSVANVWSFCTIGSCALLWYWWKKPHPQFPPGPRGFPLLGVFPYLGKHPQKVFRRWAIKYGPVMSVRMADKDVVFLNTYEAINEALVKQKHAFSGRPPIELYNQVVGDNGITFMDYTDKQRLSKKLALQALKKFGAGKKEMENLINEETKLFVQFLETKQNEPLNFEIEVIGLLCNIISKIVIGSTFDYNDDTPKRILHIGMGKPGDSNRLLMCMYFYKYLCHVPPFRGANQRFIKGELQASDILRSFVDEHKNNFKSNHINDFVDLFLNERDSGKLENKHLLTDQHLEVCVRDMIEAASNDIRILLNWDVLCLLNYPQYHDQIVEEILNVIGPDEPPSMSHQQDMPITSAFLQEIWRFCPVVPNGVMHRTTEDAKLFGFHIPKGTHVAPNIYSAHYDPLLWDNPETFDPQRHIDDSGQFIRSSKIIPCSIGPRFCLGRDFAHVEEFLALAALLRKFVIKPAKLPVPPIDRGITTLVYSPEPYEIILSVREG